jgi:glycosyltransferase involved in cell wall biosynthesis
MVFQFTVGEFCRGRSSIDSMTQQAPASVPDVSVVISTFNRAEVLPRAIQSLLEQDLDAERFEIVIVDNNSTDDTRPTVEAFVGKAANLRYVFEPRQGVSYGRNAGILAARAPAIAFTDDDVRVSASWLSTIVRALAEHPEVACVGGRVLPNWAGPWPAWLTREHWGPLALLDYGDAPVYVNAGKRLCLITANVAYRRKVFDQIGMFSPHVQTLGRAVATEDHEILLRLWRAGGQGLYWPALTATADIVPERMSPTYHRRWHHRHGRFLAIMHDEDLEQTKAGRFLGVPAHIFRRGVADLGGWIALMLRGDVGRAFTHEIGLWTVLGFIRARWREYLRMSPLWGSRPKSER